MKHSALKVRESDILRSILHFCTIHPVVVFVRRMNVGAHQTNDGRYVRFGFKGCSDLVGMLRDGRFLAIEVKGPRGKPTPEQIDFLAMVRTGGGVAFIARSIGDCKVILDSMLRR